MIQHIILFAIIAGALFFAVRYVTRIFSGKGSCCADGLINCPMKGKGKKLAV